MRRATTSLALAAVLLVGGCSAGGDDAASESASGGAEGPAADLAYDSDGSTGAAADELSDTSADARQFVTSGSITMTVEEPREAADEVARLVEHTGGYLEERVEQSGGPRGGDVQDGEQPQGSAYLVMRIPADQVTSTVEQLEVLGTVESISITSAEVTAEARDLDARIRALEISISRLEAMLAGSGTTSELVEAEQVLTERQVELERLQSQRAALADQVAMSTIRLDLWTEDAVPPAPPTGFWGGLVAGWTSLVAALTGVLVAVGAVLPWLVFLGLLALVVVAGLRYLSRRRGTGRPAAPGQTSSDVPAAAPSGASPVQDTPARDDV